MYTMHQLLDNQSREQEQMIKQTSFVNEEKGLSHDNVDPDEMS